ncbi:accessory Sec system protein Asp2 [Lacticaseibacillus jixiensis]|uniref:accessory Sec system protein Asp2 n=1 Tax=Lacticaseibacillus jixiensis TaxID=3231926 RepID=UPI0036F336DE
MKDHTLIIQLGGAPVVDPTSLDAAFTFEVAEQPEAKLQSGEPLFAAHRLGEAYQQALMILSAGSWAWDAEVIKQLPANRILYAQHLALSPQLQALLALRGGIALDLKEPAAVSRLLNDDFFPMGSSGGGYALDLDKIALVGSHPWQVLGNVKYRLSDDFGQAWQLVAQSRRALWVPPHAVNELRFESAAHGAQLQVRAQVVASNRTHAQLKSAVAEQTTKQPLMIAGGAHGVHVQLFFYARGFGTVEIGSVRVARSRGSYGAFELNGQRLSAESDLYTYFEAGDMHPPLTVYFAGYREAPGFEGKHMMRALHGPFLLIADGRLEGGAFYLGDSQVIAQLVGVIRDTLHRLGFASDQLILTGLSMGTYGALYYARYLKPRAVVIGKPLIHLGTIAANGKLVRPEDFATAKDCLLYYQNSLSAEAIAALNARFDENFLAGDYQQTTFAIAYMQNDDYDATAFVTLRDWLKTRWPKARLLAKGLVGRHNDDTNGIVTWFVTQLRHQIQLIQQEAQS